MAGDQLAVLGHHQIGLDVVGTQLNRLGIAFQRVLRQIAAGPAMRDDERARLRRGEGGDGEEQGGAEHASHIVRGGPGAQTCKRAGLAGLQPTGISVVILLTP